jgi:dihydroorotase
MFKASYFFTILTVSLSCLLFAATAEGQSYDLLLKGGHVISAKNKFDGVMDIAIAGGKIARIEKNIDDKNARQVISVAGMYVTPGLIDMHVHVFNGDDTEAYIADGLTSLPPDGFTFRAGVTTVVDAGSSGWRNFRQFKKQTIDKVETRVLALLNIAGTGMHGRFEEQDTSDMNPEQTAYMIKKLFPKIIVGIKAAHYWGNFTQVDKAVDAGKLAGVPVMVDFGEHDPPNSIEALFMQHMRPGDIFTHSFSYGPAQRETIVDENGQVKPFVFKAQQRGIVFDVGHGGGAFSWRQAVPAARQGFWPNVISTDLHAESMNGGMKDLSNLLSKFMALGLSLQEVVLRATWNPAQVINRTDLGNLDLGADADIAVFSVRKGNFGFLDVRKTSLQGKEKLETELTLRAGKIVWDLNGISAVSWEKEMQKIK